MFKIFIPVINNGCSINPCVNGGTCSVNSYGLQICACPSGFTGVNCQYSVSCAASPCQNGATCVDQTASGGTYSCQCAANFYGQNCAYQITSQTCNSPDVNSTSCATWKAFGFCSFTYTYNLIPVPIYCPQTCSLCSTSTCTDSQSNCALWSSMNLCSKVNSINPNLCLKSCGGCVGISRSIVVINSNITISTNNTKVIL